MVSKIIKRRPAIAKITVTKRQKIWKDRSIIKTARNHGP